MGQQFGTEQYLYRPAHLVSHPPVKQIFYLTTVRPSPAKYNGRPCLVHLQSLQSSLAWL